MREHQTILALLLAAILASGCAWPLSETTDQPTSAAAKAPVLATATSAKQPDLLVTSQIGRSQAPTATALAGVDDQRDGGHFAGRSMRFDLPDGYRVLESIDGGCFLFHESRPGFLIFYPAPGESTETLTTLLNATANPRHTEPPLEVDIGGLTFVGLFVETDTGSRLFLAAADGWVMVVQGTVKDWPTLASGLNQVLTSLFLEEGF